MASDINFKTSGFAKLCLKPSRKYCVREIRAWDGFDRIIKNSEILYSEN